MTAIGLVVAFSGADNTMAEVQPAATAATYQEINWDALVPEDWAPPQPDFDAFFEAPVEGYSADIPEAPVVAAMDGQRVKLPGYLVPVKLDGEKVREFLMVPYFGACIHVPPPPPNQVVHVTMDPAVKLADPYGAHWVSGTLSTKGTSSDLATAAYTMTGDLVNEYVWEPYVPPEDEAAEEAPAQ